MNKASPVKARFIKKLPHPLTSDVPVLILERPFEVRAKVKRPFIKTKVKVKRSYVKRPYVIRPLTQRPFKEALECLRMHWKA